MFKIKVKNTIEQNGIKSIAGICENLNEFAGQIRSKDGQVYSATYAIGRDLIPGNQIEVFRVYGDIDLKSIEGETLTS